MTGSSEIAEVENDTKVQNGVLDDIKHPLEDSWCIWLITSNKSNWTNNIVNLASFDTVEDWWCLYHYMKSPSELKDGQDYAIFKNGIRPTWEDKANENGGRWIFTLENRLSELNSYWLLAILLLIGATLKHKEAICGVVFNMRARKRKIAIWINDASNETAILSIGTQIKRQMGYHGKINFHKHNVGVNMYLI